MLKISVVTVSFNHGEFIERTIQSVQNQGYENLEHIIIDGGSTDETLKILERYPHLDWTSEPDKGQGDALNKGFNKATGDIIVWLNSDDWLEDGVLHKVAAEFSNADIVLAKGTQTDKAGNSQEQVSNSPRSFFDLLRFWVPYSWLVQPAVFFRRELFNEVKLPNGKYIDESFYFAMDYELWMRLWAKQPRVSFLDENACYYRVYEDNKTGAEGEAVQRECSRVFRRHEASMGVQERPLSFVVPASSVEEVQPILENLRSQQPNSFEVLFCLHGDAASNRKLAREFREQETRFPFYLRSVSFENELPQIALLKGAREATGRLVAFASAGASFQEDWSNSQQTIFETDWIGAHISLNSATALQAFGFDKFLEFEFDKEVVVMRRAVLDEFSEFRFAEYPDLAIRYLLMLSLTKGWQIACGGATAVNDRPAFSTEHAGLFQSFRDAFLLAELDDVCAADAFQEVRRRSDTNFRISDDMKRQFNALREQLPANWWELVTCSDPDVLEAAAAEAPGFEPLKIIRQAQ